MSHTTCKICGTRPRVGGALGPGSSGLEIYCDVCGISVRDQTSTEGAWSKWEALMKSDHSPARAEKWVADGDVIELLRTILGDSYDHLSGECLVDAKHSARTFLESFAARLSQGAPDTIRELMRNQQTPSAEDRALIANNMEFLVGQGAQGEAVAWRSKSYDPIFNGGYAWAFTCDPGSVTPSHEPLYTHPAERAAVPDGLKQNGQAALAELSNALEDLQYSPDQRPVPLIREAMERIKDMLIAAPQPPEGATVSIGLESAARQAYAHWAEFGPTPEFGELMDHLGEALDMLDSEVINRPGYDSLWSYFGLSYASFLVLPRAFMHAMPGDWQGAMARLLRQWDSTWNWPDDMPQPIVQFRDHGGYVRTPSWLINYRHPETKTIEALRVKPKKG